MDRSNNNEIERPSLKRKLSFVSNFSRDEEERLIGEATTTNYEKVIKILNNIKNYLEENISGKEMVNDLNWVLSKVQNHTLYTYDLIDQSSLSDRFSVENNEIKSFVEYINDYSDINEFKRRNRDTKISKTTKITVEKQGLLSKFSKRNKSVTSLQFEENPMKQKSLINSLKLNEDDINLKVISELDFDIMKFESEIHRENVLPVIGKYSYTSTNLLDYLNTSKLDCFLELARDGYKNVPYHSSLHASDLCQTILIILLHSNIIDVLHLSPIDVISIITASLLHDIGHPGLNNTYQINNFSDVAITYNDKSVLENFHIAESFRLLRRDESNIFSKFDKTQYRNIRKRMIELILATDMMFHAKIVATVKNRLLSNNISEGKNSENLINIESQSVFDDQQEIINFLIHTCDLAHNAKAFDISFKWTYMLMNEFWNQGDLEREKGLPISFLCDRHTSDVPRNQIVFIKTLVIPNFELLIDLLPEIKHFKDNLENNVNCWIKIFEDNQEKTEEK